MYKIILVEDEKIVMEINKQFLTSKSLDVVTAKDIAEAKELLQIHQPDCAVLDVMLPDGSGLDLCHYIKERFHCPVIFLSNLSDDQDRIDGFLQGGDDYVVKPVNPEELYYRILARMRNYLLPGKQSESLQIGNLVLNDSSRECRINGELLNLTEKEFSILSLLAHNPTKVFSIQQIYHLLWGVQDNMDARTVQSHLSNLRKKMMKVDPEHETIVTVWGVGYQYMPLS